MVTPDRLKAVSDILSAAIREAVEIEREACAKIADVAVRHGHGPGWVAKQIRNDDPDCDCGHGKNKHEWKTDHDGETWLRDCTKCDCDHWHQTHEPTDL